MTNQFVKRVGLSLGVLLTAGAVFASPSPVTGVHQVDAASKKMSVASSYSTTSYSTTNALNLRSGASTKHKVMLTIPKGKTVGMKSNGKSWSKVTYSGKTGYVSSKYVKKTTKTVKESKIKTLKVKTKSKTSLYAIVTPSKKAIATIPANTALVATAKLSNYYKVMYKGQIGWVATSALQTIPSAPVVKPPVSQPDKFLTLSASQKALQSLMIPGSKYETFRPVQSDIYMSFMEDYGDNYYLPASNFMSVYYDSKKLRSIEVVTSTYSKYGKSKDYMFEQIETASNAVFGKGAKGSSELNSLLKKAMTSPTKEKKYVTLGGHKTVFIQQPGLVVIDFGFDDSEPELD